MSEVERACRHARLDVESAEATALLHELEGLRAEAGHSTYADNVHALRRRTRQRLAEEYVGVRGPLPGVSDSVDVHLGHGREKVQLTFEYTVEEPSWLRRMLGHAPKRVLGACVTQSFTSRRLPDLDAESGSNMIAEYISSVVNEAVQLSNGVAAANPLYAELDPDFEAEAVKRVAVLLNNTEVIGAYRHNMEGRFLHLFDEHVRRFVEEAEEHRKACAERLESLVEDAEALVAKLKADVYERLEPIVEEQRGSLKKRAEAVGAELEDYRTRRQRELERAVLSDLQSQKSAIEKEVGELQQKKDELFRDLNKRALLAEKFDILPALESIFPDYDQFYTDRDDVNHAVRASYAAQLQQLCSSESCILTMEEVVKVLGALAAKTKPADGNSKLCQHEMDKLLAVIEVVSSALPHEHIDAFIENVGKGSRHRMPVQSISELAKSLLG